jgi:outer membrane protein assembly factor BamB
MVYVMDLVTDADTNKLADPGKRPKVVGKERLLCLDAKTGKEAWKHQWDVTYDISYPAGPRCTPTVHEGKAYALGAVGNLVCVDVKSGKVAWEKDFGKEYGAKTAIWGWASHPLVDGDNLICVVEAGGKRQLLIWDAEAINSLDPETGKAYWSETLQPQYGMSIMAPRLSDGVLFAGGIGWVSAALELGKDKDGKPTAKELWRGSKTTSLSPINMTPFVDGDTIYGFDQPGMLRAVDLKTGKRLWETFEPLGGKKDDRINSGTGFLVRNGERYFLFTEKGELILCKLSREKYEEIDRAKLLEPTGLVFGRQVAWSHPAFADKCVFARNDKEIVCYSLAE